jgi:sulfopyruvate decarboxylase TPP-binding subunit
VNTWQTELAHQLVAGGAEVAAWVPDKRLDPVAEALTASQLAVRTFTREEECVGFAAGFRAAGGTPVTMFQCSGLGNAQNALASLAIPYGLGFLMILSMRGTLGERNPSQLVMGRATTDLLSLLGIQSFPLRQAGEVSLLVHGALSLATAARQIAAIVLAPELELGGNQ